MLPISPSFLPSFRLLYVSFSSFYQHSTRRLLSRQLAPKVEPLPPVVSISQGLEGLPGEMQKQVKLLSSCTFLLAASSIGGGATEVILV